MEEAEMLASRIVALENPGHPDRQTWINQNVQYKKDELNALQTGPIACSSDSPPPPPPPRPAPHPDDRFSDIQQLNERLHSLLHHPGQVLIPLMQSVNEARACKTMCQWYLQNSLDVANHGMAKMWLAKIVNFLSIPPSILSNIEIEMDKEGSEMPFWDQNQWDEYLKDYILIDPFQYYN